MEDMGRGRYGEQRAQIVPLSSLLVSSLTTGGLGNSTLGLKLLLLKAASVNNKTCLIQDIILCEAADRACIMETWLDEAREVNLSPNVHQISG